MTSGGNNLTDRKAVRNSGIELLKIFGILLIVISHVVQTLCEDNLLVLSQDYVLDLTSATTDIQYLLLSILRYSGVIGNTIFFVCSAWFLLDSNKFNAKKWFFMLVEVWTVSVIILAITFFARSGDISLKIILQCLMPTTFATNWYMTCYLLFYPIHTVLNKIIRDMSRVQLLRSAVSLAVLYIGFNFIRDTLFFPSRMILWITIYFVVAYIKIYLPDMSSDRKANVILLLVGIVGHFGIIIATNFLGLRISLLSDKLLYWNNNCNPFVLISVIALMNTARSSSFKNRFINHVSGLSLLIYIIHENLILRTYYRPYAINYIYENYGYSHILMWVLLLSAAIFAGSLIMSVIYEYTLRKLVSKLSQIVYKVCGTVWNKAEALVLKLH